MDVQTDVKQESKSKSAADTQNGNGGDFVFSDQRPEAIAQRKLQELISGPPGTAQLKTYQAVNGTNTGSEGISYTKQMPEPFPVQQKTGNAATGDVVQQVALPFKTPAAPQTAAEQNIVADANTLDGLTDAAYTNTMNRLQAASAVDNPVPLTRAMFPGITEGHFATMVQRLGEDDNALKAAAVGYAIEDQVTFSAAKPAAAEAQVAMGGARPDFIITHGADAARRRGVVDLTSSGQSGHVLDKDFSIANFALVWESIYPSIDFDALLAGPVVLAPATMALVNNIKRRKANDFVWRQLYTMRRNLDMYSGGIMNGNEQFEKRKATLLGFMGQLPENAVWSGIFVGATNNYIGQVNELLDGAFHLPTINDIAAAARAKYGVDGGPMWL